MDTNFKNQLQMMKNIKRYSTVSLLGLVFLILSSCSESSDIFTISNSTTPPVLSELSFSQLELDGNNTTNPALTLNWAHSDYGLQTVINYNIQFSKDDTFSAAASAPVISGNTSVTLSMSELNTYAGNTGLNPFEWSDLYVRVVSSLGDDDSAESSSNSIKLSVYPYFNYVFSDYYLVGNATSPDWNNNNNNPALFRDSSNSDKFYYTGYFGAGEFKVLETKGQWQPQWGTNNTTSIDVNPGGGSDPGTFPNNNNAIAVAGFYSFTINFSDKTFAFDAFDASGITSPASLTIQGSSTANVAMTPLTFDGHIWYANSIRLVPGEVEFVTDSGSKWGGTTSFSGTASDGGGSNPVIVEDDYDVWFNDLTGRYILIPLNL